MATELITGVTLAARRDALLGRLCDAHDPVTHEVDALIVASSLASGVDLSRALIDRLNGQCWLPPIATFGTLVTGAVMHLDGSERLAGSRTPAWILAWILSGQSSQEVGRATLGRARSILDELEGVADTSDSDEDPDPELVRLRGFATAYRDILRRIGLVDERGLTLAAARQWSESGYPHARRMLVVYDLPGLSPVEHRLFAAITPSFAEVVVTAAALDGGGGQPEHRHGYVSLEALSRALPEDVVTAHATESDLATGLSGWVGGRLFASSGAGEAPGPPDGAREDLRVLRCPGRRDEVRAVARSIRDGLGDCRPAEADFSRFAVVVPPTGMYEPLIDEVFPEYGLPAAMSWPSTLIAMPRMRVVMKIVLALGTGHAGWTVGDTEDVLAFGQAPAAANDGSGTRWSVAPVARRLRAAGVVEPFDEAVWRERLAHLGTVGGLAPGAAADGARRDELDRAPDDLAPIAEFVSDVGGLRESPSADALRVGLLDVLERYGLTPSADGPEFLEASAVDDLAAWWAFLDALGEMAEAVEAIASAVEADRAADHVPRCAEYLRDALTDPTLSWRPSTRDGVRVITLAETHGASLGQVHVVGMVEGEMPSTKAASGRDRTSSEPAGLDRYGFRQVLLNAEAVLLTYPQAHRGRPLVRSSFVEDVLSLMACEADEPVPWSRPADLPAPLSTREVLIAMGRSGSTEAGDGLPIEHANVDTLIRMERGRSSFERWGAYDGYLDAAPQSVSDAIRAGIGEELSVTSLNTYAQCPMRFFFRYVLGLAEPDRPDPTIPPTVRGELVHESLERFLAACQAALESGDLTSTEAAARMQAAASEAFAQKRGVGANLYWEEEQRFLLSGLGGDDEPRGVLRAFVDRELESSPTASGGGFAPGVMVEVGFGTVEYAGRRLPAYEIPRRDGTGHVALRGRVDRVDVNRETHEFRVYDYKSGAEPQTRKALQGIDFQLMTYLESLVGQSGCEIPVAAAFYGLKDPRKTGPTGHIANAEAGSDAPPRGAGAMRADVFERFRGYVRENTVEVDEHMRAGRFHVTLHDERTAGCGTCSFRQICRLDRVRQHGMRTEQPHYRPEPFSAEAPEECPATP